jgi:hypothetical protein
VTPSRSGEDCIQQQDAAASCTRALLALTRANELLVRAVGLSWCEAQWREALCSFDSGYLNGLAEDIVKLTHSVVARASAIPAKVAPHDPSIPAGK